MIQVKSSSRTVERSQIKVLILSRSPISTDPRVLNQITWLQSEDIRVDVIGLGDRPQALKGEFHALGKPNISLRFLCYLITWGKVRYQINVGRYLKRALRELDFEKENYLHILLNDLDFVPIVHDIQESVSSLQNIRFHIDLHEYFPGIKKNLLYWFLFGRHTNWLLGQLKETNFDTYSTVSPEIANRYIDNLGINSVLSIENLPVKLEILPRTSNEKIEVVYHGNCDRSRGVYLAVDAIGSISSKYQLNLMLTGNTREIMKIKAYVLKKSYAGKIRFIDPVPVKDIVSTISSFDIGLAVFDTRKNESLELALPNKFFEYIQARLGVLIGSSKSMIEISREYNLGIEIEDFTVDALATSLSELGRNEVNMLKLGADSAAHVYHSENAKQRFMNRF